MRCESRGSPPSCRSGLKKVKLALITGATGGLGMALAKCLSKKNYRLILSAREEKALKKIGEECNAETIVCDLAKDVTPLLSTIENRKPDLVINNAGFGFYGPFETLPRQEEMIEVNIKAPVSITMKLVSVLKEAKKEGTVLNIASAAGYFAYPYFANYAASKTFLRYFSEAVDYELQGSGIRVLVTMLGQVDTQFREKASQGLYSAKDGLVMQEEKTALAILKQIEKGNGLCTIDWRYKLALFLSRLVPQRLLQKMLSSAILKRIK